MKNLRSLILFRYGSNYAKNTPTKNVQIPKVLQPIVDKFSKKFPRLAAVYGVVYGGLRGILDDVKSYLGLLKKITDGNEGLERLTLEELEFFHSFKINAKKLIPIATLAVLPFGNAFIIPLVYFKPRTSVTPHFWTENQKATFPFEDHKDRLEFHQAVFNHLKKCPSGRMPDNVVSDWRRLLEKLDQDGRPDVSDVAKVSSLFHRNGPFYLQSLPKMHLMGLGSMYGVTSILSPLRKIIRFAQFNLVVDKKIIQRGGPKALPDELRSKICYIRGVDSMNMSQEEQIVFLRKWLQLNAKIDITNYSLLLHTPVLLGYNKTHVKSETQQKR